MGTRNQYDFMHRIEKGLAKFKDGKTSYKSAKKMRVFMRQNYEGPQFLGENRENWTMDPECAMDFTRACHETLANTYTHHTRTGDYDHYVFVDVTVEHRFEAVPMDSPEMVNAIRERALSKLSLVEVQALGAESIAIYYKLKNHKVDEDGDV